MDGFGWAFIGAGKIATSVAKRVFRSGGHRLIGVYNRTPSRAAKLAARYGAKVYASVEEAAADERVDALYINVTNDAHFRLAMRAVECGKPVLSEKPFTVTAEQARELFAAAEKKGVYICEAMWTWFLPQPHAIKNIVGSREYGGVGRARFSFCAPIAFSSKNRVLKNSLAGGALLDLGVYPIAYAYRLFGAPLFVEARARYKHGVDVSDDIVFGYDGFDAEIRLSVQSFRGRGERLEIEFEKAKLVSRGYHCGGGFVIDGKKTERTGNAMLVQFDRVAEEIRAGKTRSEFVPPESTVAVMELLDAVRKKIGLVFACEN